ncbi:MAG: acyltransferase domain-containing protein [Cellulosilyticaceae bacterium]
MMNAVDVARRLEMPEAFMTVLEALPQTRIDFCKLFREQPLEEFVESVRKEACELDVEQWTLLGAIYLQLAAETYEVYLAQGIAEQIYWDTMSDLKIWAQNCYHTFGVWGIAEYGWLTNHINRELFRLGRLQFQPIILSETITCQSGNVETGTRVLNIHIPQGEPLLYEACRDAYERARDFFKDQTIKFVCDSWLLDPIYQKLLSETSNIVKFQRDFEIYERNDTSRQAEERIFGALKENPEEYIGETSLQRKAAAHLKAGGRLGSAKGIIYK